MLRAKLEELTKSLGKLRQEKVRQEEEFQAHEQELIAQFNSQLNDQVFHNSLTHSLPLLSLPPSLPPSLSLWV
jgi:hypothetical protein